MIVAIDASTTGCSVALFNKGRVLASIESEVERSSAENLTLMIEELLRLGGIRFADLQAVAVAKGPGSYTGLRIAVSTAKGLAFGLEIPLISYGTLEGMCRQIPFVEGIDLLCPMIDARRMEVFCGLYHAQTKEVFSDVEALIVDSSTFGGVLSDKRVLFFGEGSHKCQEVIESPNAYFSSLVIRPSVRYACGLVSQKFDTKDFEDLVGFEPFYLKDYMFKK